MNPFRTHFEEAHGLLSELLASPAFFHSVRESAELMAESIRHGGKILSCGNGGSLCDAMHFAEELTGRYRENRRALPAISISDPSHLSCTANDYGYDAVFARYVDAIGRPGDVLLAISTSGKSPSVLRAAETAREKGMKVVALTGKDGGALAPLAHAEVRVPWNGYADRIQEVHIKVIHSWIDYLEQTAG